MWGVTMSLQSIAGRGPWIAAAWSERIHWKDTPAKTVAFWHEDKRLPDVNVNLPIKKDGHTWPLTGIRIELTMDGPKLVVGLHQYQDKKYFAMVVVYNIRNTTGATIQLDLIRSVRRGGRCAGSGSLISTDRGAE